MISMWIGGGLYVSINVYASRIYRLHGVLNEKYFKIIHILKQDYLMSN